MAAGISRVFEPDVFDLREVNRLLHGGDVAAVERDKSPTGMKDAPLVRPLLPTQAYTHPRLSVA